MTLEMGQLWHPGTEQHLAGGSWQCCGIAGFPKVVESIPGAGGKGRVALPFLQLHGEGEVCDSPHSYLIHYDEAGV